MSSHPTEARLAWIALGIAFVITVFAIVWLGASNPPDYPKPPGNTTCSTAGAGPQAKVAPAPPVQRPCLKLSQVPTTPITTTQTIKALSKPNPTKVTPAGKRANLRALADMFPVGNILRYLPRRAPVFRTPPEVFETFVYGNKLWMATGNYALQGQVDLVPTGFSLNGRPLFALANTAGPGEVLFLQSEQDPRKFAIYRSI